MQKCSSVRCQSTRTIQIAPETVKDGETSSFLFLRESTSVSAHKMVKLWSCFIRKKAEPPAQGKVCYDSQVLAWFPSSMSGNTIIRVKSVI